MLFTPQSSPYNICGKKNVVQLVQYVVARKNLHALSQPYHNYLFINCTFFRISIFGWYLLKPLMYIINIYREKHFHFHVVSIISFDGLFKLIEL